LAGGSVIFVRALLVARPALRQADLDLLELASTPLRTSSAPRWNVNSDRCWLPVCQTARASSLLDELLGLGVVVRDRLLAVDVLLVADRLDRRR
jgi:hypothetical protein